MGQYFIVVNYDRKEYIHPHKFGDGLKLMEFGNSAGGTMLALALLLRQSNEGGGGDYRGEHGGALGLWAGDAIVIVGDYDSSGLYDKAFEQYRDVSEAALELMVQDSYVRHDLWARGVLNDDGSINPEPWSLDYSVRQRRWEMIENPQKARKEGLEFPEAIFGRRQS